MHQGSNLGQGVFASVADKFIVCNNDTAIIYNGVVLQYTGEHLITSVIETDDKNKVGNISLNFPLVRRCNGTTVGLGYWKVGLE